MSDKNQMRGGYDEEHQIDEEDENEMGLVEERDDEEMEGEMDQYEVRIIYSNI